jgi:CYTH domain-containing protein
MIERERKFICWHIPSTANLFEKQKQIYLYYNKSVEIRVRIKKNVLSNIIKSEVTFKQFIDRERRYEFTLPIGNKLGKVILLLNKNVITKHRYIYIENSQRWEIDRIISPKGLPIIAEFENINTTLKVLPKFIKYEVTGVERYKGKNIYKYNL